MVEASVLQRTRPSAARPIIAAGLACGVMDYTAACVTWWLKVGATPARIARGISSALLGPQALQGGAGIVALGVFLHFFIAFSWATIFYLASRKLKFLTRNVLISGPLYGFVVYLVMYWIVVPLSAAHRSPFSWNNTIVAIITHMVCVGSPIAIAVKKFSED